MSSDIVALGRNVCVRKQEKSLFENVFSIGKAVPLLNRRTRESEPLRKAFSVDSRGEIDIEMHLGTQGLSAKSV